MILNFDFGFFSESATVLLRLRLFVPAVYELSLLPLSKTPIYIPVSIARSRIDVNENYLSSMSIFQSPFRYIISLETPSQCLSSPTLLKINK